MRSGGRVHDGRQRSVGPKRQWPKLPAFPVCHHFPFLQPVPCQSSTPPHHHKHHLSTSQQVATRTDSNSMSAFPAATAQDQSALFLRSLSIWLLSGSPKGKGGDYGCDRPLRRRVRGGRATHLAAGRLSVHPLHLLLLRPQTSLSTSITIVLASHSQVPPHRPSSDNPRRSLRIHSPWARWTHVSCRC